jgi:hypothetical protein
MSLFSTPSPPSEAGGPGPAGGRHGGRPDFPSPTKLERNGLTGTELDAQILISVFPVLNQREIEVYFTGE